MNPAHSYPVRLAVVFAISLAILLPSGFIVNCVGADGHKGSEILGLTHCDESSAASSPQHCHADETQSAWASSSEGCTDTPLTPASLISRSEQDQDQAPAFSPAPLLFVINLDRGDLARTSRLDRWQHEPVACLPYPPALRCIILNV